MLKDAEIISKGIWKIDDATATKMGLNTPATVRFDKPSKYDEGYSGEMQIFSHGTSMPTIGKYTITAKNKVTINDGKGSKSAAYQILNDGKIFQIDYVDDGDIDLYLTEY